MSTTQVSLCGTLQRPRASQGGQQDYDAMGKLLGQAFLSHQVSQLEHKIHSRNSSRNSPASNSASRPVGKRAAPGGIYSRALIGADEKIQKPNGVILDTSRPDLPKPTRAADRIVVDTSVLIHALDQVRKWSREATTVVVPLESERQSRPTPIHSR
jgi:hypothetical protein